MQGRWRRAVPDHRNDRGAVAVLFAIFLIVFMVLLAFVVDLGQVYARKAQMQGVVDAAVLAGAGVLNCSGTNTGAAQTEASLYGQSKNGVAVNTPVINGTTVYVSAQDTVNTFFGGFAGRKTIDVAVDAQATKDCSGGYAAFAGSGSFDTAGAVKVTGSVYSGAQTKFTSGNSQVTGSVDVYVASGGLCQGSCNIYSDAAKTVPNPASAAQSKLPACYAYEIGLYGAGGTACAPPKSATTGLIEQLPTSGSTYRSAQSDSDCELDDDWWDTAAFRLLEYLNCGNRDVTISRWDNDYPLRAIQTSGRILMAASFSATNSDPRRQSVGTASRAVLLYTTNPGTAQNNAAIDIQGSNSMNHFGYLYAPNGAVYANGNGNLYWTGTMIAKGITVKGTGSGGGIAGFLAAAGEPRLTE